MGTKVLLTVRDLLIRKYGKMVKERAGKKHLG